MENQASEDRLSDLPLGIIHEILVRVPIEDAIKTCLLSKFWRYNWTTLPHLVFNCDEGADLESLEEDGLRHECTGRTENFISNVLLHHKGHIHSFKIVPGLVHINVDSIEKWIRCMSRKDIRELSLHLDREEIDDLHHHPPFKDGVESLVACCPLLEALEMIDCSCSELRIRSPNLNSLVLLGSVQSKLCLYAPLLAEINVGLAYLPKSLACNYTNFLGCFTNLVKLTAHSQFMKHLSIGMDSCHDTLVFLHLRVITLTKVNFADTKEQSVVLRLIIGAPNLHKLVIACFARFSSEAPYVSFEDIGCEPNFTLEKLRDVMLYRICDHSFEMHFIKLLLESSPVLETVDLNWISPKAAAELLGFRRSFKNARISVHIKKD